MIESTYITLTHHDEAHRQLFIDLDVIVDLDGDGRVLGVERIGGLIDVETLVRVVSWLRAQPLEGPAETSSDTMSE